MKVTIINSEKKEKSYAREELADFVAQLRDGTFFQHCMHGARHEVCFAAEWHKQGGEPKDKTLNPLVLLSVENLRDLATVEDYKRIAAQQPYTLLAYIGHDGHSLHIVCPYNTTDAEGKLSNAPTPESLRNAFRKLHYVYSSQLRTPLCEREPTFADSCKVSFDPQPFYRAEALPITVGKEPEDTPAFRATPADISDYNDPDEIPGLSHSDSRLRRFHDCLDQTIAQHRNLSDDDLFAAAVVEQLANGCRQMGLPQAWSAQMTSLVPMIARHISPETRIGLSHERTMTPRSKTSCFTTTRLTFTPVRMALRK